MPLPEQSVSVISTASLLHHAKTTARKQLCHTFPKRAVSSRKMELCGFPRKHLKIKTCPNHLTRIILQSGFFLLFLSSHFSCALPAVDTSKRRKKYDSIRSFIMSFIVFLRYQGTARTSQTCLIFVMVEIIQLMLDRLIALKRGVTVKPVPGALC